MARSNLRVSQRRLSQRLVAIYTGGQQPTTLEILLGASSLDDVLNRIDAVDRVSGQDATVIGEVTAFRAAIQRHELLLKQAHAAQSQVVASRAAQRASIQSQLAARQQLLSTIHGQITQLKAEEHQRQLAASAAAAIRPQPVQHGSSSEVLGVSASTPEGATVAPPSRYGGVVGIAMRYLGVPYVWGGSSPSGFDCSGLVVYAFGQIGVSLPHSTYSLYGMGSAVSRDQLQPGDLVFFNGLGHMGIYIGGGQFIHAPHTGDVVKISSLSDSWYASTWVGARRIT